MRDERQPRNLYALPGAIDSPPPFYPATQRVVNVLSNAFVHTRRLALQHHPDKSNSPSSHSRFQQIGFAYSILSSPSRKKRYDATGKTDELRFGLGEDGEGMDWDEYFATLWEGEVTGDKLREFKQGYQGEQAQLRDWYRCRSRQKQISPLTSTR